MYSFIKVNQMHNIKYIQIVTLIQHGSVQIYHLQEAHVPKLKSDTNGIATCSTICSWF